ncbi:MAG: GYD domain-containing protein [Anaerolineae bacterium]|jgi:uncharacterized protein with GYD domain
MAKYLLVGSYTDEGLKGLLREGGSKRKEAAAKLAASVGGKLEALYFALGDNDFYEIVDVSDNVSVSALSLVANSTGAVKLKTVALLTAEEVDQAVKETVDYRPPGD